MRSKDLPTVAPPSSSIVTESFNKQIIDGYVTCWDEFEYLKGADDMIGVASSTLHPVILISNQAGIGKGLMTVEDLDLITIRMVGGLLSVGAHISAAYICPHAPQENCSCRKPKPGLMLQAASDFNLDLRRSVLLGDAETDILAARNAGCIPILFDPEHRVSEQVRKAVLQISAPHDFIHVLGLVGLTSI